MLLQATYKQHLLNVNKRKMEKGVANKKAQKLLACTICSNKKHSYQSSTYCIPPQKLG